MDYLNLWLVVYLALGAFVGFLAGLLGIGGGMILVPFLVVVFQAQGFLPAEGDDFFDFG